MGTWVVIDLDEIHQQYQLQETAVRSANMKMPYTEAEEVASTVAHELAHGVNVNHHGMPSSVPAGRTAYGNSQPPYHIYGSDGVEINDWPYPINGRAGTSGNDESGDLSCFMLYTVYQWAFSTGSDGSLIYRAIPVLPRGKKLCTAKNGTGKDENKYFGDATYGNCLGQIKLKP